MLKLLKLVYYHQKKDSKMYNTQKLLFSETEKVLKSGSGKFHLEDFYDNGYSIISGINSADEALGVAESVLAGFDTSKSRLWGRILSSVQLAKADAIPLCRDSVETSFQALHFDMGQPIVKTGDDGQLMIAAVALYHPKDVPTGTAYTRVVSLDGLARRAGLTNRDEVDHRIKSYALNHGDGWNGKSMGRISCFARIVDALSLGEELVSYYDKTMAEWFREDGKDSWEDRVVLEHDFYASKNFDISDIEKKILLKPGEMLILDNTGVVHGRAGRRREKEIYQFMFGIQDAGEKEIDLFRASLVESLLR